MEFRYNQVGYGLFDEKRMVVVCSNNEVMPDTFSVMLNEQEVLTGTVEQRAEDCSTAACVTGVISLSSLIKEGEYQLKLGESRLDFHIRKQSIGKEEIDKLFLFFDSQRCGEAITSRKPCHLNDKKAAIDCSGGWHDAGDYIKFMVTTAYVTLEFLYAYEVKSTLVSSFAVSEMAKRLKDEIEVGIKWMLQMTSRANQGELYFQVSGAEDHSYWRLPEEDDISGVVGNPRALHKGWGANLTGRCMAAFALYARLFPEQSSGLSSQAQDRVCDLYRIRNDFPEVQGSNPKEYYTQKYWEPDMLLGLTEFYRLTDDTTLLQEISELVPKVEPWRLDWADVGFLSFYALLKAEIHTDNAIKEMTRLLEKRAAYCATHPYGRASKPVWGTTAECSADGQMAVMYYAATGDEAYLPIAQKQRDYLLGFNNWGVSFIIGIGHKYPVHAHSQLNDLLGLHIGGVVGGPADKKHWQSVFNRDGAPEDTFAAFQGNEVYYDWVRDYYTNEVAIDYAAPVLFLFLYYAN